MKLVAVVSMRWLALALVSLVVITCLGRHRARVSPPAVAHFARVSTADFTRVVGRAFDVIGNESEALFDRVRALAALAAYRGHRFEHERCTERSDGRYQCPRRSIRISRACLDNPLGKDCM